MRERASSAGHDPAVVPAVRRAHDSYAESAELRLLPGIYAADGLRLNNYRNGILGVNYIIEFTRDDKGLANGIAAITTRWVGDDRALARTKRTFDPKSTRARRASIASRRMPAWADAYVPRDALWEYLSELTLPRAIEAGTVAPTATVEDMVRAECVPMVLSKKCISGGIVCPSGTTVGVERVGRALWMRLLASCWWGKVMGDWDYAAFITNDKVETLKEFYSADAHARWAEAGGNRAHWDHPRAFELEMLRIRDDRDFVPTAGSYAVALLPSATKVLAQMHTAASERSLGTRGIRRARPGQPTPAHATVVPRRQLAHGVR